jgi:hypothetical protein
MTLTRGQLNMDRVNPVIGSSENWQCRVRGNSVATASGPGRALSLDLFAFLCYALVQAEPLFYKIPGSNVITRYVKSSHQNDPGCTVLEILLALFAIRTLLQSRTRADNGEKHFIHFSEKVCQLRLSFADPRPDDPTGDQRAR